MVCVNKSGTISLIKFEGSRDPVVFWPILVCILKVAVRHGSDAVIMLHSVLEDFDLCELDNANVALAREQVNQRQCQFLGFADW